MCRWPLRPLLDKLMRHQQREIMAKTSGVAVTGAGVECAAEYAAADRYAADGAVSTNLLIGSSGRREERGARARVAAGRAAARVKDKKNRERAASNAAGQPLDEAAAYARKKKEKERTQKEREQHT